MPAQLLKGGDTAAAGPLAQSELSSGYELCALTLQVDYYCLSGFEGLVGVEQGVIFTLAAANKIGRLCSDSLAFPHAARKLQSSSCPYDVVGRSLQSCRLLQAYCCVPGPDAPLAVPVPVSAGGGSCSGQLVCPSSCQVLQLSHRQPGPPQSQQQPGTQPVGNQPRAQ